MTDPERAAPHEATPAPSPWGDPPRIFDVALKGLCPRCGRPTLFRGFLTFANRCPHCGLPLAEFNVGDGPAAFLTLILGTVIVGLAIWLELAVAPPWWVHALLWPPVALAMVVGSLRLAKGALIAAEYRNKAREGRFR